MYKQVTNQLKPGPCGLIAHLYRLYAFLSPNDTVRPLNENQSTDTNYGTVDRILR